MVFFPTWTYWIRIQPCNSSKYNVNSRVATILQDRFSHVANPEKYWGKRRQRFLRRYWFLNNYYGAIQSIIFQTTTLTSKPISKQFVYHLLLPISTFKWLRNTFDVLFESIAFDQNKGKPPRKSDHSSHLKTT